MTDPYAAAVDSLVLENVKGKFVQRRIASVRAVDTFAAKRLSDGLEALLLEVDASSLLAMSDWPATRGLAVERDLLGDSGRVRIVVQLLEVRYRDVFRALCSDACRVMASARSQEGAVRSLHLRLFKWRSFLERHGPDGLSDAQRCGLFGELLILCEFLLPGMGPESAVPAWRGCKKAHQDYQWPNRALEVKTTRAAIPDRVTISNIQQLDSEGIAEMYLAVVHVNENESVGETLPELVGRLRSRLPDPVRDELDGGLEEVGYSDAHRELYGRTRYQQLSTLFFGVEEGFPRLTRDQIPKGVKAVRYDIALDACRRFRREEPVVVAALKGGAS